VNVLIKTTNREVWEAHDAMAVLVTRGWKSGKIALAIGKTFRRMREKREEIDEARTLLLADHAARADDGGFAKEANGEIRLKTPVEFGKEWRTMLLEACELEIFPIKAAEVEKAKVQLTAYQYEILVNLGALEDGTKEKDEEAKLKKE